jgi:hypothetical protein
MPGVKPRRHRGGGAAYVRFAAWEGSVRTRCHRYRGRVLHVGDRFSRAEVIAQAAGAGASDRPVTGPNLRRIPDRGSDWACCVCVVWGSGSTAGSTALRKRERSPAPRCGRAWAAGCAAKPQPQPQPQPLAADGRSRGRAAPVVVSKAVRVGCDRRRTRFWPGERVSRKSGWVRPVGPRSSTASGSAGWPAPARPRPGWAAPAPARAKSTS